MPCIPFGEPGGPSGFICVSGEYTHLVMASCPWCCLGDEEVVHAFRFVHSGWCAPDLVCGFCGQYHTEDARPRRMAENERNKNVLMVAKMFEAGLKPGPFPRPPDLEDVEPLTLDVEEEKS